MVEGSREAASLLQCGDVIRESDQRVCGSPTACEMEAMPIPPCGMDGCPVFRLALRTPWQRCHGAHLGVQNV